MGLDITAYRRLEAAPDAERDEDGHVVKWDEFVTPYDNEDFPGRAEGLDPSVAHRYADEFGFRAGSYSGYSAWRDKLAVLVGYKSARDAWEREELHGAVFADETGNASVWAADGTDERLPLRPFFELINFSDCEGSIGPVVSAKLARDFAEFDERAKALDDPYFYRLYTDWRTAFEMAADGGMVDFH